MSKRNWKYVLALVVCLIGARSTSANLVGLYTFSGNAQNSASGLYHGTAGPAVTFGAGYEGQAAIFSNVTNSFIDLAGLDLSPAGMPQLTMGAWVNASAFASPPEHTIVSTNNPSFNNDRGLTIHTNRVFVNEGTAGYSAFNGDGFSGVANSGAILRGSAAAVADDWVFVAARYDQATKQTTLFVGDQKYVGSSNMTASNTFTRLGAQTTDGGRRFIGGIDNVFFYNESLTDQQIASIAAGGVAAIVPSFGPVDNSKLISVDFNATTGGAGAVILMNGIEGLYGYGETWNHPILNHRNTSSLPANVNPSWSNLVNGEGAVTGVNFSITGNVYGWNSNRDGIRGDYLVFGATGSGQFATSTTVNWLITGLDQAQTYELFTYGGIEPGRDYNILIDTDGDGSLLDELALNVDVLGRLIPGIRPDASGRIIGQYVSLGHEAHVGGFQLRQLPQALAAVPEPASIALWIVMAMGLAVSVSTFCRRSK